MNILKPAAVIGTNSWGSALYEKAIRGSVVDEATIKAAVNKAIECDLLIFDSARDYGFGKGPKMIGELCPEPIVLSSKYTPVTKYKKGQVKESFDKDLKDFKRDKIEIYWLHLPNGIEENLAEIIELYRQGKIEHIGVSNFDLDECKKAKAVLEAAGIPLYGVQNHYSLLDRTWEENGLVEWCMENDISFWAWAVLEEGILAGPARKEEKFSLMKAIFSRRRKKLKKLYALMQKVGERHDISIAQVAIAFVANKGIVPVCGCRKPYQVEELCTAANVKLTEKEMSRLQEASDALHVRILGADMFRFAVSGGNKKK